MLPTPEKNKDMDKNTKVKDQRKNRLGSNSWVEVIGKNARKKRINTHCYIGIILVNTFMKNHTLTKF